MAISLVLVATAAFLRLAPPTAPAKSPAAALRLPQPVMLYGPVEYRGSVVPNAIAMSLQDKVELLRTQLNIRKGLSLSDSIDKALKELGLQGFETLNIVDKADACLEALGVTVNAPVGPGVALPPPPLPGYEPGYGGGGYGGGYGGGDGGGFGYGGRYDGDRRGNYRDRMRNRGVYDGSGSYDRCAWP